MNADEATFTSFLHLSAGLRSTSDAEGAVKFWPFGKNLAVEVTSFPQEQFGAIVSNAGLRCIGNEERIWMSGYEDRLWNPSLVVGVGQNILDWPGHDWAALGTTHRARNEDEACRLSSAAGFHLMGASRRLMHISEWYHQMLLYAHLKDIPANIGFANSDHINFLIDCQSFLSEVGSARDYISAYAGRVIAGISDIGTFYRLARNLSELPDELKAIVDEAWSDRSDKITLKHIGRYRDEIVHQRPISELSNGRFETEVFELGLDRPVLGVKFDVQVWPDKKPDIKFDALKSFHAMMRVLYQFGRAIILLAKIDFKPPTINFGATATFESSTPIRRVSFP